MSDYGLGADVVVAIGSAFSGVTAPPQQAAKQQLPPVVKPSVQSATAHDAGDFFLLQKRVHYRLLYPSRVPLGSTYGEAIETGENPFYSYKLGKHGMALAVDARTGLDSSHAWGLRYTTWTDAPILDQPSRQVCWNKRLVRIYTNGRRSIASRSSTGATPARHRAEWSSGSTTRWTISSPRRR